MARYLGPTLTLPADAECLTAFGHYAGVLKLRDDLAIAICTDGVGTKTVVASALDRYDTIGYDCVAMNVNDLVCVGARPLALVDYVGVHTLDSGRLEQILQGLGSAAKEAGVAVPGGEVAQLPDVIGSDGRTGADPRAFDLVGTAIGTLRPDQLIDGSRVAPGDAIVGIRSSGLHSNGYTLARRVCERAGLRYEDAIPELGCTLGDELLRPTEIYVGAARALWDAGIDTKGMAHITGDGFLNLCRLGSDVDYLVDDLPEPHPIFGFIQQAGEIDAAEMYKVFNMGIGFAVVVASDDAEPTLRTLSDAGYEAHRIGETRSGVGQVHLQGPELVGDLQSGFRQAE